jgi:hypothetical protein
MIADTGRQTSTATTDIASIVADPAAEIEFANPMEESFDDNGAPQAGDKPDAAGNLFVEKLSEPMHKSVESFHQAATQRVLGDGQVTFKVLWLSAAYTLVLMQLLLVNAVSVGAVIPNCKSNSNCQPSQYC